MNRRLSAYILLLIVSIIWGVAGPVIKFTLGNFPPLIFLTYRFALSAVVALIAFGFHRPRLPKKTGETVNVFIYGLLTSTVSLGLLFLGFDKTTALTGTLLSAAGPVFVAIAGVFFLHERVTKYERVGLSIAFIGTVVTIVEPIFDGNRGAFVTSIEGNLLVVTSLLVGVVLAVQGKLILRNHTSPSALTHISFLIGCITIAPIALYYHSLPEIISTIVTAPLSAHLGVWFMALLSGTLAYTLWHKGQKAIEISEVSVFTYLYPIWATPLAIFWLGETITPGFIAGAVVIALGVVIAERKKRQN
ncbi:hypothetical protein A2875_03655 [Candidatus Gottesmanbacteria bacterium RIFCSPHIGHO2_01_FULL_46_14]|uniref:EamA domain-containing protein n=1 Tax=Candidatus Gottesmanbacteria bacterium RIFCSPHIGHO2_01_FULL_46_14 TaxID=1798380 RepID=A0A1F5ZMX3_9BACT|nr:MAG: hypothetical protein A2875_03655 [Candidatus Gottesmanbacteria bacterium RIFCSPHIGHO2_01_FULL_46_14]